MDDQEMVSHDIGTAKRDSNLLRKSYPQQGMNISLDTKPLGTV
jgi:hypothetical protein